MQEILFPAFSSVVSPVLFTKPVNQPLYRPATTTAKAIKKTDAMKGDIPFLKMSPENR